MKRISILAMFVFSLVCTQLVYAQSDFGRITGTITDGSGAVVAGAQVSALNTRTNESMNVKTDSSGFYAFPSLPASTYDITVTMQGFSTRKEDRVVLDAASDRTYDLALTPGATTQEVTVIADEQQVQSSNAQVTTTIDSRQIENIALNGRNPMQLLRLLPGTVSNTADPFAILLSANGQQINGVRGNAMMPMLDGMMNVDNGGYIAVRAITNPDSIAQMRVLSASYGAEYTGRASAVMNVVTKSGSKDFHGSIFEFVRNDLFDADSFFFKPQPGVAKQPLHFNDYGYTLGGPIRLPGRTSKLFFFIDQEWRTQHVGITSVNTVPTAAERNGDFSALSSKIIDPITHAQFACLGVANVICGNRFSANGPKLIAPIPLPNQPGFANNYIVTADNNFDSREDRVNLDYAISDRTQFSTRWTEASNFQFFGGGGLDITQTAFPRPMYMFSMSLTHDFSPTLLNTVIFGFAHNVLDGTPYSTAVQRATLGLTFPTIYPFQAFSPQVAPSVSFSQYSGYNPGSNARKSLRDVQLSDDLTKVLGNHVLKGGLMLVQSHDTEPQLSQGVTNGQVIFNGTTTGNSAADALLGDFTSYKEDSTGGFFASRYYQFEFYAQDTWKLNRHLSFDYGARYVVYPPNTNPYQNATLFNPALYTLSAAPQINPATGAIVAGTGNPYNGLELLGNGFGSAAKQRFPQQTSDPAVLALFHNLPNGGASTPKGDFAPRVGIAFDPTGDGKMSIRAGFGAFYDHTVHFTLSYPSQNPPFDQFATVLNGQIDNPSNGAATFPQPIYSLPLQYKSPVVYTANLDVQRQMAGGIILDIGYVGTFAHHLSRVTSLNQLPVGTLTNPANKGISKQALRPYPGYDDIAQLNYADNTNYESLQSTVSKRSSKGVSFSVSYTWSKTMDDTTQDPLYGQFPENSYNIKADYGLSDISRANVLTANAVYDLPFFTTAKNAIERTVLGGWTLSSVFLAQSGQPTDIVVPQDTAGIGSVFSFGAGGNSAGPSYERAQQVGNPSIARGSRTVSAWFNKTAFAVPAAGTYGNVARDSLIGPGFNSFDLSAYKHFKPTERTDFEFRAETFNLINHPSYTSIGNLVGSPSFGTVTGSGPGRVIQLGAKLLF